MRNNTVADGTVVTDAVGNFGAKFVKKKMMQHFEFDPFLLDLSTQLVSPIAIHGGAPSFYVNCHLDFAHTNHLQPDPFASIWVKSQPTNTSSRPVEAGRNVAHSFRNFRSKATLISTISLILGAMYNIFHVIWTCIVQKFSETWMQNPPD